MIGRWTFDALDADLAVAAVVPAWLNACVFSRAAASTASTSSVSYVHPTIGHLTLGILSSLVSWFQALQTSVALYS